MDEMDCISKMRCRKTGSPVPCDGDCRAQSTETKQVDATQLSAEICHKLLLEDRTHIHLHPDLETKRNVDRVIKEITQNFYLTRKE